MRYLSSLSPENPYPTGNAPPCYICLAGPSKTDWTADTNLRSAWDKPLPLIWSKKMALSMATFVAGMVEEVVEVVEIDVAASLGEEEVAALLSDVGV